eukprot:Blabericola_migrator_1__4355@NODE_2340_length_2914_cov_14_294696_g1463_i0_p2_GENE_NODE_2340_length_2914_cov_14_294696_g1463_i0NODE_2340_length_2914_cov_14_294696_g1463_i0_p2_ORF_typecomplete_len250_score39_10_NODE_2340_length_2914_cov_14_294696_g1463_i0223972
MGRPVTSSNQAQKVFPTNSMRLAHPVPVVFEARCRLPKGRDIRLYAAGTIPELGYCKIDDPDLSKRLDHNIRRLVRARCIQKWRQSLQVTPFPADDSPDDASVDSYDSEDLADMWDQVKQSGLDLKMIAASCLAEVAVPLEEDPDDTGIAYLWASDPVPLRHPPGTCFSYFYFAWDLETNKLWSVEKFSEARELKIPKVPDGHGDECVWVCRTHMMHCKEATLSFRCESEDSDGISEDFDDSSTESDLI